MLQAGVVHHQHDQVHAFSANLQAPASSAHADKSRRAPSLAGTAYRDAAPVLGAEDETSFDQVGNHHHALGAIQHLFGDALIGSVSDFPEDVSGILQPLGRILAS